MDRKRKIIWGISNVLVAMSLVVVQICIRKKVYMWVCAIGIIAIWIFVGKILEKKYLGDKRFIVNMEGLVGYLILLIHFILDIFYYR